MTVLADLPALDQRKVAAIVGACVADAAAQPLHWIYKEDVMLSLTKDKDEIEFTVPSANPFYNIETGRNTCYGDQAYVMLKSIVEAEGLNIELLTKATYDFFGPTSDYESKVTNNYQVGKEDKINLKKSYPIDGPWRNGCIKDFLKNLIDNKTPTGSADDDQIDCVIRIIPIVALYAGHPDMLYKVEAGLRVLQDSDLSVAAGLAAARVLEQYILEGDPGDVLKTVIDQLSDLKRKNPQDLDVAVIGQLRQVVKFKDTPHVQTVSEHFKKN